MCTSCCMQDTRQRRGDQEGGVRAAKGDSGAGKTSPVKQEAQEARITGESSGGLPIATGKRCTRGSASLRVLACQDHGLGMQTHWALACCVQALKDREEAVRNGKLTTIIFIRDRNVKGQEVSGYIDYGHRCECAHVR